MKRILVSAIIAAASINAYAESNVTLYGVIDQAVAVTKHKHKAAKVRIDDGIYAGSRFGIKGTEDLGGGTQVFFNLDQAFLADNGSKTFGNEGKAFSREANGAKSPSAVPAAFLPTAERTLSFTALPFGLLTIQTAT
mgnify:CR=1 FL=1